MNFAQLGWFGWRKFKFPSVQRHPNQTVKVTVHEGPENGQRKHHQTRRPPPRSMTDASDEVETLLWQNYGRSPAPKMVRYFSDYNAGERVGWLAGRAVPGTGANVNTKRSRALPTDAVY